MATGAACIHLNFAQKPTEVTYRLRPSSQIASLENPSFEASHPILLVATELSICALIRLGLAGLFDTQGPADQLSPGLPAGRTIHFPPTEPLQMSRLGLQEQLVDLGYVHTLDPAQVHAQTQVA